MIIFYYFIAILLSLLEGVELFQIFHSLTLVKHQNTRYHRSNSIYSIDNVRECIKGVELNFDEYLIAGAVAGGCRALSRGLTYPFDTIKTLVQASNNKEPSNDSRLKYFRGIIPTVVAAIPSNALFFLVYNTLTTLELEISNCNNTPTDIGQLKILTKLIISTIATLPQNAVKIPAELLKQRAQTQQDLSFIQLVKQAYDNGGTFGFYRGGEAQLLREIPYNAIQMISYAYLNPILQKIDIRSVMSSFDSFHLLQNSEYSPIISGVAGLISASIAAVMTQPFDVIKTKLMTNIDTISAHNAESKSTSIGLDNILSTIKQVTKDKSFINVVKDIYASEGISGFFTGLKPRLYIVSIGGSVYFWASSAVELWLHKLDSDQ